MLAFANEFWNLTVDYMISIVSQLDKSNQQSSWFLSEWLTFFSFCKRWILIGNVPPEDAMTGLDETSLSLEVLLPVANTCLLLCSARPPAAAPHAQACVGNVPSDRGELWDLPAAHGGSSSEAQQQCSCSAGVAVCSCVVGRSEELIRLGNNLPTCSSSVLCDVMQLAMQVWERLFSARSC